MGRCKISIADIFPCKVACRLLACNIIDLQDLLGKTSKELLSIPGFGKKRLQIVIDTLGEIGWDFTQKHNKRIQGEGD